MLTCPSCRAELPYDHYADLAVFGKCGACHMHLKAPSRPKVGDARRVPPAPPRVAVSSPTA